MNATTMPTGAEPAALMAHYEQMLLIRRFEEEIQRLFLRGEVPGTTHLCIGQEAVAIGVGAALRADDLVAATYRGHGHALARGVGADALAAEMLGRATGVCGGRSGSMNVIDLEHGLLGCFGIVGGSIAAATGAALSLRGSERIAVAFFGDGTANQAYFAECLNFARVLELPVLLVCEHNLYGEYTPWEQVTAGADIPARAAVLDIPTRTVDGNDVRAVQAAALDAARQVRGGGPFFLECRTYRQVGHSRSDPGDYRPPGELESWLERDPLRLARAALADLGVDAAELTALEDAAADAHRGRLRDRARRAVPVDRAGARVPRCLTSAAASTRRSPRRWSATRRSSCSARTSPSPVACSRSTTGLVDRFGPARVIDTPISELALAGAAFGSAITGLRPVVEIMFGDFMALPMDSIINQAAKVFYLSGGRDQRAAGVPHRGRRGRPLRPDPLAEPRHVAARRSRDQGRLPRHRLRRPRRCCRRRSAIPTP